ncbi:MAG: FixH family protein [Phycisphaerae bacterium]|nr:FixH family protein [Phycisphaerae bacterium]
MNLVRDRWMFVPIALLAVSVTVATSTVWLAVAGRPLGEEPDYYAKAVAWDAHRAQHDANDRLRWTVSPEITASSSGAPVLTLKITDKYGNLIDADAVGVEAIPVKRADRRCVPVMIRVEEGRFSGPLTARVAGQWEFRITVRGKQGTYTDSFRRTLMFADESADASR